MRAFISIAGFIIEIDTVFKNTVALFHNYLILKEEVNPDLVITTSYKDVDDEFQLSKMGSRILTASKEYYFFNREQHEFVAIHRKIAEIMPQFNTILVHGAVVALNGQAYMFCAPSGTGKTTRIRLWQQEYPESIIVNGDKPFIKIADACAFACGTPWCGKEGWNTNTMVPLKAVFFLERTDNGEHSSITEISISEAFPFLLLQTYYPNDCDSMQRTLELLKMLDGRVKFYHFRSELDPEAIHLAYNATQLNDENTNT